MTDPLSDIRHYSPTMTISQVIKFCEKKDMGITRAMIQNYIRMGLLPPPVDKRFYTHKHLAVLALIERLKTVSDMPAIKKALAPHMDGEGLPLDVYTNLVEKTQSLTDKWLSENTDEFNDNGGALLTMACAAELMRSVT